MRNLFRGALATLALALIGCGSNGPITVSNDRVVPVHATLTLAQGIDAGHYKYVDSKIQSNFKIEPIAADYEAKLVVVHFNRDIGSADAVLELQARGLRPANTAECLAYGAEQKRISREWGLRTPEYWLVCLGSTATSDSERSVLILGDSERHVLELGRWSGGWGLNRDGWSGDWRSGDRFLATRP